MFGPTPATAAFIEASGADRVIGDVIDHAAVGARLSVVALHYDPVPTSYLMLLMKELTIRGSIEYPARFADAIDLLARRDLSGLLTHRYPLERVRRRAQPSCRPPRTAARCSSKSTPTQR